MCSQVMAHPQFRESSPAIPEVQLRWTPEAERVFEMLKAHFTTYPMLAHPNPSLHSIVEVDASEVGVGAVLSQHTIYWD